MTSNPRPHASTPPHRRPNRPPRTWAGIALYVCSAALVPLALFALSHPAVVAAGLLGTGVGALAGPSLRRLARRPDRRRSVAVDDPPVSRTAPRSSSR
ncbi:hypothetical protein NGM10_02440 [Halorussus salilacus]|uniref:hypothetical protein n=1 Tax=Halorussus salilacus TaxID=2953750 RepID=UPI00209F44F5|nr:hypothetical protein [Halorussus salilacus]USZ68610.1 hypothetical protein NGM10_02440 [Halorussus salilacus]